LSLVLRHKPETIQLQLDTNGWATVVELIDQMNISGRGIDKKLLHEIVASNDKQRFTFNDNFTKIRANQGHSINVNLDLAPIAPPAVLYHGTAGKYLSSILKSGLQKQNRQHVHLSEDVATASKVGMRHGRLVILTVASADMHEAGFQFYQSKNGVWLTVEVPVEYLGDWT